MYREQRIISRCEVEFDRLGQRVQAVSEDVSVRGVFVRTDELLAVGAAVDLALRLPDGGAITATARVVHLLTPAAARVLGRRPGMGFEFVELDPEGRQRLIAHLDRLNEEVVPRRLDPLSHSFAVIADASQPLLDRISNALTGIGFETLPFRSGAEALGACHELIPDVVVAALDMPAMDGLTLLGRLKAKAQLAEVPVVLMSEDASDFTRLLAYRLGVTDVIPKPFTDEELCIRVRRAAVESRRPPAEPVLRGSLSEISVATLLSLFEFERKSGILLLRRDDQSAKLFIAAGRVVKVEGGGPRPVGEEVGAAREARLGVPPATSREEGRGNNDGSARDPRSRVMTLLDWRIGRFEFTACEVIAGDELGLMTQQLLLEHARIRDEEARGKGSGES